MSRAASLVVGVVLALGLAACPCGEISHTYVISGPDPALAASLEACLRDPARICNGRGGSIDCVPQPCMAVCRRATELGGQGAHRDQLTHCFVSMEPADAAAATSVNISYPACD